MRSPRVVGFAGSPRRPSKTRGLVEFVSSVLSRHCRVQIEIYDLFDAGPGLGASFERQTLPPPAARIVDAIEQADALIVGTPVYKGSYAGLFKHAFDLIDPRALASKPVLLTATGGGQRHALVVEHSLRPLFGFFEAQIMPTAIYASDSDFTNGKLVDHEVVARIGAAAEQLAKILRSNTQAIDEAARRSSLSYQSFDRTVSVQHSDFR
jgi:FMN reductase